MTEKQNPHAGHKARLRERFCQNPLLVPDYELLEMLLGYVLVRKDTKALAKELLLRFDTLRGVLNARHDELVAVPGFGNSLCTFWLVLHECFARHAAGAVRKRETVTDPHSLALMAQSRLSNATHEECWVVLLDSQNRLLQWMQLRQGELCRVAIEPREVLAAALRHNAVGIVLVHNHPGGNPKPSAPDLTLTHELGALALRMNMRLIDHIIVTGDDYFSLASHGLLDDLGE